MTRPTLIYAARRSQAEAVADALGGRVLTSDVAQELVTDFHEGRVKVLVTTGGFATGWRAPENTLVIYLDGFDPRPEVRAQTEARVHRSNLKEKQR
jgi:superfamily II DNA or RNA helicase